MSSTDELPPVVIDIGGGTCRIGSSGCAVPEVDVPTVVGYRGVGAPPLTGGGLAVPGVTSLRYPVGPDGLVEDWDALQALLDSTLPLVGGVGGGGGAPPSLAGRAVIVSDALYAPRSQREAWCSLLFERYSARGVYCCRGGVLALFANARTTGLAVDFGASGVTVTSVQEGFPLMMGSRVVDRGGSALDAVWAGALGQAVALPPHCAGAPPGVTAYWARAAGRAAKEAVGTLLPFDDEGGGGAPVLYTLPDGTVVDLTTPARGVCPWLYGEGGAPGLGEALATSVAAVDPELRALLVGNTVAVGGGSSFPGSLSTLQARFAPLVPAGCAVRVVGGDPQERRLAAWLGGSILGGIATTTLSDVFFTDKEFAESGAKGGLRKFV